MQKHIKNEQRTDLLGEQEEIINIGRSRWDKLATDEQEGEKSGLLDQILLSFDGKREDEEGTNCPESKRESNKAQKATERAKQHPDGEQYSWRR